MIDCVAENVKMNDRKNHQLYEELKRKFRQMEVHQVLVVTALGLERMWKPFVQGLEKTEYTANERTEFLQIEELRMDLVWERIKRGEVNHESLEQFHETMEREYKIIDVERNTYGSELEVEACYLDSQLIAAAESFFTESKFDEERCAEIVSMVLGLILHTINDMLYREVYKEFYRISKVNSDLTRDVLEHHPGVLEEIKRVEMDLELAMGYPQNMNEILIKRMEYHQLDVCDIKPFEAYGMCLEPVYW